MTDSKLHIISIKLNCRLIKMAIKAIVRHIWHIIVFKPIPRVKKSTISDNLWLITE